MNFKPVDYSKLIQLEVPYEHKDQLNKCLYNPMTKKYYCHPTNTEMIDKYSKMFVNVSYEDRDVAKNRSYKWDPSAKSWYTYSSNN